MLSGWTFHDPLYLWLLGLLMVVAVLRRQRSVTVLMVLSLIHI